MTSSDHIKVTREKLLSDSWGTLTRYDFALKLRDGSWSDQRREVYDRGHGAVCLLHNPDTDTVLLTRQFRLPVYVARKDGFLVEAPAGLLEGESPAVRMRAELEEETGFAISEMTHLYDVYMSPGSVTEYLAHFIGTYSAADQVSDGGGAPEEGEDIEVLQIPLDEAFGMIKDGRIADAKTIILIQHLVLKRGGLL